ncbi:MAG: hypothetical protein OHK0032_17920 [Thermodesulfovibrionales bacterium]
MKKTVIVLAILLLPFDVFGAEIVGPEVRLANNEVSVMTGLVLDGKNIDELKNGVSKEITFYIDLFRVWKIWPNEFIAGKKLIKTLRCDPIKKEYTATSFDGATLIKKRFRDFDSMLGWALNLKDIKLINIKEIEPSDYFVRVTVESRLRNLPPVIGYLLFFVPEKEFKVTKDSPAFAIGGVR